MVSSKTIPVCSGALVVGAKEEILISFELISPR